MFNIFNENYYLDLVEIEKFVNIDKTTEKTEELEIDNNSVHVNIVKFDLVKMLLDVIMTEDNEVDEKLGLNSNEITIPFRFAFNTLLNNNIIKKY